MKWNSYVSDIVGEYQCGFIKVKSVIDYVDTHNPENSGQTLWMQQRSAFIIREF